MFVKISTGKEIKTIEISKKILVTELKELIELQLKIDKSKQKLFYGGKLLENNTPIYKYNIQDGYVIQLIEINQAEPEKKVEKKDKNLPKITESNLSEYYKIGEFVEFQEPDGSWSEGEITEIFQEENKENTNDNKCDIIVSYKIIYKKDDKEVEKELRLEEFRPRSIHAFDLNNLKIRQKFHVNYCIDNPNAWGKWYDFYVEEIDRRKNISVVGHLILCNNEKKENITLRLNIHQGAIFSIRNHMKISERDKNFDVGAKPIFCDNCKMNKAIKCKECGCSVCGSRKDPEKTIVCDECQCGFHIYCLKPSLKSIPEEDDWYCDECKNQDEIVKEGETIRTKRGITADNCKSKRDWGIGMATAGKTTTNTIVPITHFGCIPGVEVGTTWLYRIQVSESGVHRPPVAGIAGRQKLGAFSIVLSGGYEDDEDDGDEVLYTGSGGRDLSGNKRVSTQSCDQELTRLNLAIAKNCNAPINSENGSKATNWKEGKPIRVVRSYKEKSKYAPEEGFRYDGLYKVVEYFRKTGKSGFKVWQFLLRRDDPAPAPWTPEGKKFIQELGLDKVIYPENYGGKNKRRGEDSDEETSKKRVKVVEFELGELKQFVEKDKLNEIKWREVNESLKKGKIKYLEEVQKAFQCVCCQDLIFKPVTTPCKHNFCLNCFKNARKVMGKSCPLCKTEFEDIPKVNENLDKTLLSLFPGYENGR